MAVEDAEALTAKLAKYQQQLDKMKSDMDKVNSQNVQLRNTVGHLEAALEKVGAPSTFPGVVFCLYPFFL